MKTKILSIILFLLAIIMLGYGAYSYQYMSEEIKDANIENQSLQEKLIKVSSYEQKLLNRYNEDMVVTLAKNAKILPSNDIQQIITDNLNNLLKQYHSNSHPLILKTLSFLPEEKHNEENMENIFSKRFIVRFEVSESNIENLLTWIELSGLQKSEMPLLIVENIKIEYPEASYDKKIKLKINFKTFYKGQ